MTLKEYKTNYVNKTDGTEYSLREFTSRVHQLLPLIQRYSEMYDKYQRDLQEAGDQQKGLDDDYEAYRRTESKNSIQDLLDAFNEANDHCDIQMEIIHSEEMRLHNMLTVREKERYVSVSRAKYEDAVYSYPDDVDVICRQMDSYRIQITTAIDGYKGPGMFSKSASCDYIYDMIYESYAYHKGIRDHFQSMFNEYYENHNSADQGEYEKLTKMIQDERERIIQSFSTSEENWKYAFQEVLKKAFPEQYLSMLSSAYSRSLSAEQTVGEYLPAGRYSADISQMSDLPFVQQILESYFGSRCRNSMFENDMVWDMDRLRSVILQAGPDCSEDVEAVVSKLMYGLPPGYLRMRFSVMDGDQSSFEKIRHVIDGLPEMTGGEIINDPRKTARLLEDGVSELLRRQKSILHVYSSLKEFDQMNKVKPVPWNVYLISGFPYGFTDDMLKNLRMLMQQGPKAGLLAILVYDPSYQERFRSAILQSILSNNCIWKRNRSGYSVNSNEPYEAMQFDYGKRELTQQFISSYSSSLLSNRNKTMDLEQFWNSTGVSGKTDKGVWIPVGIDDYGNPEYTVVGKQTEYKEFANMMITGGSDELKLSVMQTLLDSIFSLYSPKETSFILLDMNGENAFGIYRTENRFIRSLLINGNVITGNRELNWICKGIDHRMKNIKDQNCDDIEQYRQAGHAMGRIIIAVNGIERLFDRDQDRTAAQENERLMRKIISEGGKAGMHLMYTADIKAMKINADQILDHTMIRLSVMDNAEDIKRIFPALTGNLPERRNNTVFVSENAAEKSPRQVLMTYVTKAQHEQVMQNSLAKYGSPSKPVRITIGRTMEEELKLKKEKELQELIRKRLEEGI